MSNKHAIKEAPASYQSKPVPSANRDLQNLIVGNPLTENLNLWISATKAKSTSGRGSNKKIELVGIKKLRELILELAVRGKLAPQNPDDEPASELLKKIEAEKEKLIAEGKIKKQKKLPEISEDEKPFELPESWEWTQLPEIYYPISPSNKKLKASFINETGKFPVVDQGQEFIRGFYDDDSLVIRAKEQPIILFGDHTKVIKLIDFDFIPGADGTKILAPIVTAPNFFYIQLTNYKLENRGYGRHFKLLNSSLFALPPLAEQHRIVAKVNELMALCDQLEQHSEHQIDAHKQLVETLLATLVESENADDLATNWQRLAEHFDTLFSGALTSTAGIGNGGGEWAIDRLKDTILQLAVMGKLVPQNPDDEPASELLKKINDEKSKLVKEGKIKKQKPLPEITDEEKPFELPRGWEWVNIEQIATIQSGFAYKSPKFIDSGRNQVIRLGNIRPGLVRCNENPVYIDDNYAIETESYRLAAGDIIVTMTGTKGKKDYLYSSLITNQHLENQRLYLNQRLCRLRSLTVCEEFFLLSLQSEQILNEIFSKATGTANQANIGLGAIREWPVPLPPIAEQHRIVAKVDEIFFLCDQLKARLQAASETQLTLTEALVEQALY